MGTWTSALLTRAQMDHAVADAKSIGCTVERTPSTVRIVEPGVGEVLYAERKALAGSWRTRLRSGTWT